MKDAAMEVEVNRAQMNDSIKRITTEIGIQLTHALIISKQECEILDAQDLTQPRKYTLVAEIGQQSLEWGARR